MFLFFPISSYQFLSTVVMFKWLFNKPCRKMKLKELQIFRYAMVSLKSVQPSESLQIDFIFRLFAILIIISYYLVNYFPKFVVLHSYLFLHMCSNLYFRTLWSLSWNLISCWARAVSEYLGLHRSTAGLSSSPCWLLWVMHGYCQFCRVFLDICWWSLECSSAVLIAKEVCG